MTKDEAADILIEAYQGTPGEMRARRAQRRRKALLEGDHTMIQAMFKTAHPNHERPAKDVREAVKVLTK